MPQLLLKLELLGLTMFLLHALRYNTSYDHLVNIMNFIFALNHDVPILDMNNRFVEILDGVDAMRVTARTQALLSK